MSLRFSPFTFLPRCALGKKAVAVSALIIALGLGAYGTAIAATKNSDQDPRLAPPVQNYADQALPVGAGDGYYDSPLKAGTLTLQDVLEAHKPASNSEGLPAPGGASVPAATTTAPLLSPAQSSSTSLMMSQGMRSVLQKVGETSVSAPTRMRAPSLTGQPPAAATAQGQPASLVSGLAAVPTAATPAPGATTVSVAVTPDGNMYQPGQAPKNLAQELAGGSALPASAPVEATASASSAKAAPAPSCDPDVQKWEKSCGEAGYPATYIGKIVGETHTGCGDNALHDVWVSNSCAPPDASTAQTSSTDAVCGIASNNEFDDAPTANLCAQGIAGTVSGSGPWTWACSGVNGGQAAACTARTRVSKIEGECGGANGVATSGEPSADLCASGTASPVKGSGPWKWSCRGAGGGSTQSCIAPVAAVVPASVAHSETSVPGGEDVATSTPAPAASTASADKGELCGEASETLAYEAPDKDLCRVGSASVVNGDGPWTWSCTDNEGRSSSCRTLSLGGDGAALAPGAAPQTSGASAPHASAAAESSSGSPRLQPEHTLPNHPSVAEAPVVSHDLACGLAASTPAIEQPSDELCVNGKASAVRGSGPWRWTCGNKAHHKVSCETPKMADGACGAANGTVLKSAPFAGLCSAGTPTGIEGDGPWTWTCTGRGGGVNVSCGAAVQSGVSDKVEGSCGPAAHSTRPDAPVSGLCSSGAPSAVSGKGPWNWSCSGSNGGGVSSCSANKVAETQAPAPSVNGLCGAANGALTSTRPEDGLCSSGSAAAIVGSGPWNWSCLGENGGMTVSCTAPLEPPAPIDGECGGASGVPTLVKPQSGLCSSGLTGNVSGHGPWTWTCSGANGGSPASCVAPVAGKTGAMPSISKAAPVEESLDTDMSVAPASRGLVTPHLPPSEGALPKYDKRVLPSLSSTAIAPPPAVTVAGADVPDATPELAMGTEPVSPPSISSQLSSAPALQETAGERAARIPGNHLTLDPTISTVLFTRGSGNIDDGVLPNIDRLANVLSSNPDVRVTLTAYADNDGSTPRDARRLSLTRALAVRTYLESKGVVQSRVDVRAEGANSTSGYIDRVDVKVND